MVILGRRFYSSDLNVKNRNILNPYFYLNSGFVDGTYGMGRRWARTTIKLSNEGLSGSGSERESASVY
jgi:hypothetical protein